MIGLGQPIEQPALVVLLDFTGNFHMSDDKTLWVIAEIETSDTTGLVTGERDGTVDTGGGWQNDSEHRALDSKIAKSSKRKRVPLDAQALKNQMQGLLNVVNDLFEQTSVETGLQLTKVQLTAEINAEGQVSIVGNGGKISNSGGITMTFSRPDKNT